MKSIIVIGGGIAGLSAGIYARLNGFKTEVIEQHFLSGGLCTGFKRKGYTFDSCLNWLMGTKEGNDVNDIWKEIGLLKNQEFYMFDELQRIQGSDGREVIFYTNPDKLEAHLTDLAPEDKNAIEEFCNTLRLFAGGMDFQLKKPMDLYSLREKLKMLMTMRPYKKALREHASTLTKEYAGRFTNPLLKEAFSLIFFMDMGYPILPAILTLVKMYKKNAGFPHGGSLAIAQAVENRYRELGGKLTLKTRVTEIITENDKAVGVLLEDGTEIRADYIISASDGKNTIFNMLKGKYTGAAIEELYKTTPNPPVLQLSLGVNRDLTGHPPSVNYLLKEEVTVSGIPQKHLFIRSYKDCAPGLNPENKSVMTATFMSDYDYWEKLSKNRQEYKAEKERVKNTIISRLEKLYPGISDDIEVSDVATPVTTHRYTGNYRGSVYGWVPFSSSFQHIKKIKNRLPGLKNFYMAGQWAFCGSIPYTAASGRHVIQYICRDEKKKFKAG